MKKIAFIFFTSTCFFCSIYAQHPEIGLRAGPNYNQLHGNEFINEIRNPLVGFSAGAFLRLPLQKALFLLTAIQYERNSSKLRDLVFADNFGNMMGRGDMLIFMDYLVLPVMVEYRFGKRIQFSVQGGPFVSYLLKRHSKMKWKEKNPNSAGDDPSIDGRDTKSFNFGLSAGAGFRIPLNKKLMFDFQLEDHLGLLNVNKPYSSQDDLKTNSLNLTVGIAYSLK